MKKINYLLSLLIISSLFTACVDREFDTPPVQDPVELETNATIKQLKSHLVPGEYTEITEDLIIDAIVSADDRSGNYFRTLIIQDETGGIELKINGTGLYNDFPQGCKIFLKAKGLVISDYNGLPQIGGYVNTGSDGRQSLYGIELTLLSNYVVRGVLDAGLQPKIKKISELTTDDIATLIQFEEVQFANSSLGQTYADMVNNRSLNLDLVDCESNTVIVRTSNYSNFGDKVVPEGKGTFTAIYSVFNDDKQMVIRNEAEDVVFDMPRCGGGTGGDTGERINISEVRALFTGNSVRIPNERYIQGIVISDRANENITNRNIVIQQPGDKGIVIRFAGGHSFNMNDEIRVDVSNVEVSEFNGLLQLNNVADLNARKLGTGSITPKVLTIAEVQADFENLESTLVKVNGASLSKQGGNTYGFTVIVTDPTGTIDMFTTSYSTFANTTIPTGEVNLTAIVSQGGNNSARQLSIRNLGDVEDDGNPGGDDPIQMSIADVRALFSGSAVSVPANTFIEGVIISDKDAENITNRNIVIQEEGGKGITIRFSSPNTFAMNDVVKIDISGAELSEFNGLLQINNVPNSNASRTGSGSITPNVLTIAQIKADFENLESTLVRISDVTLTKSGGTNYAGTVNMNDGTGTLDLYTTNYSSFANSNFPTGTIQITGFLGQGGSSQAQQLSVRNLSDVQ